MRSTPVIAGPVNANCAVKNELDNRSRELEIIRGALRGHVKALAVDIGPRTPFAGTRLERAATYILSVLEDAGYFVTKQPTSTWIIASLISLARQLRWGPLTFML